MYLANDVIQNSKKKGPEFGKEYENVLLKAFKLIAGSGPEEKTIHSLNRILNIWGERGVYDEPKIKEYSAALNQREKSPAAAATATAATPSKKNGEEKREKRKPEGGDSNGHGHKKKSKSSSSSSATANSGSSAAPVEKKPVKSEVTIEVNGKVETHVTLSPHQPDGDPPEPEELIRVIQELENSASSDAAVRERIANLPPEVSELSALAKLEDKEAAMRLAVKVGF